MPRQKILTLQQAAEHLGVPPNSVLQDVEEGDLPGIKTEDGYRLPLSQLEVWVALRELEPQAQLGGADTRVGVVTRIIPQTSNREKGFGFIIAEDGTDIFLGGDFIKDLGITTGDVVEFSTVPGRPYRQARDVQLRLATELRESVQAGKLFKEALETKEQGYYPRARKYFREAIDQGAFLLVYTTFAEMELELKRDVVTLEIVWDALKVYPRVGKLYHLAATLLLGLEESELAVFWLKKGIEQVPSYSDNHLLYLEVLMSRGTVADFEKAVDHATSLDEYGISEIGDNGLVQFLRGARLSHKAYVFFNRIGFDVRLEESASQHVDFLVTANQPEYIDTYGLYKKTLTRCFLPGSDNWEEINGFRKAWQDRDCEHSELNNDIAFAVLEDEKPLRNALYRMLADSKDAIVPIDEQILESEDPAVVFGDQLSNWLSRRDLYAMQSPVSGRQFFGREVEIQGIMRSISEGRNIGIFGLRKVGKTSVLNQVRDKAKRDLVAYADLQSFPAGVDGIPYLYWIIARDISQEARKKYPEICDGLELQLGSASSYDYLHQPEKRNASLFDKELKIILRRLGRVAADAKIVILMDELERMLPTASRDGFPGFADFFAHIRGLAQQEPGRLVSGIAAANALICEKPRWGEADNPVFRYYQELYLPLLSEADSKQMITGLGKRMAVSYTPDSLAFICKQTGGHPFLVRLFCSHVLSKHKQRPVQVTRDMLVDSIDSFIFDEGSIFREILERLEKDFPAEYDLLLFIVSGVTSKQELTSLVAQPTQQALRHLVGYQLISYSVEGYEVKIKMLAKWLRAEGIV